MSNVTGNLITEIRGSQPRTSQFFTTIERKVLSARSGLTSVNFARSTVCTELNQSATCAVSPKSRSFCEAPNCNASATDLFTFLRLQWTCVTSKVLFLCRSPPNHRESSTSKTALMHWYLRQALYSTETSFSSCQEAWTQKKLALLPANFSKTSEFTCQD